MGIWHFYALFWRPRRHLTHFRRSSKYYHITSLILDYDAIDIERSHALSYSDVNNMILIVYAEEPSRACSLSVVGHNLSTCQDFWYAFSLKRLTRSPRWPASLESAAAAETSFLCGQCMGKQDSKTLQTHLTIPIGWQPVNIGKSVE